MSEALDKAKFAMEFAKQLHEEHERDPKSGVFASRAVDVTFSEARATASIYASIAQAEALERVAAALEAFELIRVGNVVYGSTRPGERGHD